MKELCPQKIMFTSFSGLMLVINEKKDWSVLCRFPATNNACRVVTGDNLLTGRVVSYEMMFLRFTMSKCSESTDYRFI